MPLVPITVLDGKHRCKVGMPDAHYTQCYIIVGLVYSQ